MIKGDLLSLTVAGVDDEGAGVAEHDGRRLHVPFALPGETIEATVEHLSPHGPDGWAHLVRVTGPSPARVEPACVAWGRCGGCALQHWRYAEQLAYKREQLRTALAAHGIDAPVGDCVASPLTVGYRNKSKLVVAPRTGGGVVMGSYAPRSHEVVDLAGCAVAEAPLEAVAGTLRELASRLGVRPFDEATGEGDLRHCVLRMNHGGEVLAVFVVARREGHNLVELARTLREARPIVVGVIENLQPDPKSNVLYGEREPDKILDGVQAIEERLGATRLRLSPRAFLQVNRGIAALLYAEVAAAAALTDGERAIDVYCGVGGIALTLARGAGEVVGIEEHAPAVADARAGADLSQIANARFVAADAAAALADPEIAGDRADVIVLNPPRKGCDPAVLASAAKLAPRTILYVSCSPASLGRDLAQLATLGYRTTKVTPYDMLPHTPHVEALAVLTRS
jgi:23S rRNA (uracil1939-C5)-methyltransferase